jgi:ADP-ribosylglycohydrolase
MIGAMIGTWPGALHGMKGIPAEWLDKVNARDEIDRCEQIVAQVGVSQRG